MTSPDERFGYGERHDTAYRFALHHVLLAIPPGGEDAAREFFVGVLGMTEVRKPAELAARGGLWVRADGLEIHLGVEEDFRPAAKAHPGIRVADLDALAARLGQHDILVRWDGTFPAQSFTRPPSAPCRFYADDPHGNRLEFISPDPDATAGW